MDFHAGDAVMHWTHGIGTVIRQEKRDLFGKTVLYYAVQIGELTIWVPADKELSHRLRPPTSKPKFKRLLAELSEPGQELPGDRHQRKLLLVELLKDGRAESLVGVIRALMTYKKIHPLNDNDHNQLRRAEDCLVGEWGQVLSISPQQAEVELHQRLESVSA